MSLPTARSGGESRSARLAAAHPRSARGAWCVCASASHVQQSAEEREQTGLNCIRPAAVEEYCRRQMSQCAPTYALRALRSVASAMLAGFTRIGFREPDQCTTNASAVAFWPCLRRQRSTPAFAFRLYPL